MKAEPRGRQRSQCLAFVLNRSLFRKEEEEEEEVSSVQELQKIRILCLPELGFVET